MQVRRPVPFHGSVSDQTVQTAIPSSNDKIVITPYYRNGDLVRYLKGLPRGITFDAVKMMLDIAEGMKYLHSKNILHGDLKVRGYNNCLTNYTDRILFRQQTSS